MPRSEDERAGDGEGAARFTEARTQLVEGVGDTGHAVEPDHPVGVTDADAERGRRINGHAGPGVQSVPLEPGIADLRILEVSVEPAFLDVEPGERAADEDVRDVLETHAILEPTVDAVELNASCPNVAWGRDRDNEAHLGVLLRELRAARSTPLVVKLPPFRTDVEREVIAHFVDLSRALGQPRSYAELYGLLFISPRPLPMDDLVARLNISKGSASQGLKFLRDIGAVRAVELDDDRRTHYEAVAELRHLAGRFLRDQIGPQLVGNEARLERLADGVGEIADAEPPAARQKQLETGFGGVFFLLNILLACGLYPDFTRPRDRGLDPSPFWLLDRLARRMFGRAYRGDPLSGWLRREGLPGALPRGWKADPHWLRGLPPGRHAFRNSRHRTVLWDLRGFALCDLPGRRDRARLLERYGGCGEQVIGVLEPQHGVGRARGVEQRIEILLGLGAVLADYALQVDLEQVDGEFAREQARGQQLVAARGSGEQHAHALGRPALRGFDLRAPCGESLRHRPYRVRSDG